MLIYNIPIDPEILYQNRNQFLKDLGDKINSYMLNNDISNAYNGFMQLCLSTFGLQDIQSMPVYQELSNLANSFIDSLRNKLEINENRNHHRMLILSKMRGQRFLDPSFTLDQSSLEEWLNKTEKDIQEKSNVLNKEELFELNFIISFNKIIFGGLFSIGMVDLGNYLLSFGEKFYDYIKTEPTVYEKLNIGYLCYLLGSNMLELGKNELAEEIGMFGLNLAHEIKDNFGTLYCTLIVAHVYRHKGKLDDALEYYQKMMDIENLPYVAYSYPIRYIGYILQSRGEIEKALKHYQISLGLFEFSGSKTPISRTLQNLSDIYYLRGQFEIALEYNEKSIEVDNDTTPQNPRFTVDLFYHRVLIYLEQDHIEGANEYFLKIEELHNQFPNPIIEQQYQLTKALVLKRSKRIKQKAEAQELLETIIQGPVLNHEYSVVAMQNLCDMLIDEMTSEFDDGTFKEAKNVIHQLIKLAEDQQLHLVKVHTLLLQARFDIIQDNFEDGQLKIETAEKMCEKHNLNQLLGHVNNFKERYTGEIDKLRGIVGNNSTLKERLANKEIQDYLKMALSTVTSEEV